MRKDMKKAMIAAAAMIAGGFVLSAAAFGQLDFDFGKLSTGTYTEKRYAVEGDFDRIVIDGAECSVRLMRAPNAVCTVTCWEAEKASNEVKVENGKLTVRHRDDRRWYERIGVNFDVEEITVALPEERYEQLHIETMSGDIRVTEPFVFGQAEIETVSGDVEFFAELSGELTLTTTSGDIEARGISARSINAGSTSGEITLSEIKTTETLRVSTVSGDMELTKIQCRDLSTKSTSGDSRFNGLTASGRIETESVSGEVALDACDAATLKIETTSGDVSGTLLSGKAFDARTTSGEIRVPDLKEGGACEVKTVSGDIRFEAARR